ncbi:hypothetical protein GGI25_005297 [Coemansia spiralis]|uniref:P-loop containing nucleoside triphosphate hydrolase protein n=2 Tax=Coemansia TaxID=4863 RepID=A0A9W8KWL5_9FUNG|nr:hypothetical protein EDC05_005267 [Coemansia umbellata]KAJ2619758.1 hypothetical protein GGI26_005568 [Coemansia sp. RSA 1358]KAJ2671954.1 hypothetical protein GGI25_005297 [Coemansia spiralis]
MIRLLHQWARTGEKPLSAFSAHQASTNRTWQSRSFKSSAQSFFSSTQTACERGRSKNEAKIKEQQEKREKLAKMKIGRHRARVDLLSKGRSGGGKSQLLDARMRRARDQKEKFFNARDFVQRSSATQQERSLAEARILRQRSKQLKKRNTPGLGYTPARFRLMPIENETGTDLTALARSDGKGKAKTMTIKQLAEQVAATTFENIGLRNEIVEAASQILGDQLKQHNKDGKTDPELKPTEIQALAIPEILGQTRFSKKPKTKEPGISPNVFLAAETGSGKTFAYALPIVSMLKQEEADNAQSLQAIRRERRPRALVVVPSRELVKQVTTTFKKIGHHAKIRTIGLHLGMARRRLREYTEQGPIDVIVSTPGAILRYMQQDPVFSPANVRRLVVDEADSMMDSHSFGEQMQKVLDLVRKANETQGHKEQAIFVSATLPKLVREQIIYRYPDIVHVTTPSLHRAPQKLSQTFIDVAKDFQGHRLNSLWYVLRTAANDKHIIVFCNTKTHANMVFRQLYRRGVPSLLLTGASAQNKKPDAIDRPRNHEEGVDHKKRPPKDADSWEKAVWFTEKEEEEPVDEAIMNEEIIAENEDDEAQAEPVGGANVSDLKAPVPNFDREEVFRAFASADPIPEHLLPQIQVAPDVAQMQQASDYGTRRKIMVCTDIASRGLDTTFVTHVVLFDFPTTAIDYLHRAGRTARAGGKGKVTALVGKKDRRLAEQIRLAIRQGGVIS